MYFILEECFRWFIFLFYFFMVGVFNFLVVVFGLNFIFLNLFVLEFCFVIVLIDSFKIRSLERFF